MVGIIEFEENHEYHVDSDTRVIYVGDIHGEYDLLKRSLMTLGFNQYEDLLVSVGDLIDRGPDSLKVLDLFVRGDPEHFVSVRGNHEQFLVDCKFSLSSNMDWYANGGGWAHEVPKEVINEYRGLILERMPRSLSIHHHGRWYGVTHAGLPVEITNWDRAIGLLNDRNRAIAEEVLWTRDIIDCPEWYDKPEYTVHGVDYIIHGHTPLEEPMKIANRLYIDTGATYGGDHGLTFLEFEDDGTPFYHTFKKESK